MFKIMKKKLFENVRGNFFKIIKESNSNLNGTLTMDSYVELISGEEVEVFVEFEFFPGENPVGPDQKNLMPTSGADEKITIHSVKNKLTGQELGPEDCSPNTYDSLLDKIREYVNSSYEDSRY